MSLRGNSSLQNVVEGGQRWEDFLGLKRYSESES